MLPLFILLNIFIGLVFGFKDYSSYQVCRFHTNNISNVIQNINDLDNTKDFEIWTRSSEFIDIMLKKSIASKLKKCELIISDLNKIIEETYPTIYKNNRYFDVSTKIYTHNEFFNNYRNLDDIYSWIDSLAIQFPDLVKVEHIGTTFENRQMKALHISGNSQELNPDKKTIVITGGIHAREWISVSTVCYIIYTLLSQYNVQNKEMQYLSRLDFLIIPVFNPDGYNYTWTNDRLWRKNRQHTSTSHCLGIDIDHSFDYQWIGGQTLPCSEDYSGEFPFDAIEAYHWDKYINEWKSEYNIYGYLDIHSYSQEVLYPYGYSCDALPRDLENLLELSYGLAKAIRNKSGKNYHVLSSCEDRSSDLTPGLGSGSALDYMYHHRAYWAFQIKLRDTGNHGFLLPPKYIIPVSEEVYSALEYFCDFILNPDL